MVTPPRQNWSTIAVKKEIIKRDMIYNATENLFKKKKSIQNVKSDDH